LRLRQQGIDGFCGSFGHVTFMPGSAPESGSSRYTPGP
jgi:hypothetical protein